MVLGSWAACEMREKFYGLVCFEGFVVVSPFPALDPGRSVFLGVKRISGIVFLGVKRISDWDFRCERRISGIVFLGVKRISVFLKSFGFLGVS